MWIYNEQKHNFCNIVSKVKAYLWEISHLKQAVAIHKQNNNIFVIANTNRCCLKNCRFVLFSKV